MIRIPRYIGLCVLIFFSVCPEQLPIVIVGCGYVGLTLAGILNNSNKILICVDLDESKISCLKNKLLPIYEPGLKELLFDRDTITFTTNLNGIFCPALYFVCVPTPLNAQNSCDCSALFDVFEKIISNCADGSTIIIKSTIAPGTMNILHNHVVQKNKNINLVYNPEFMREGSALHDMCTLNPVVFGVKHEKDAQEIKKIYHDHLHNPDLPIITTNFETAELIKYSWNAFSSLRIAFINELAYLCKPYNADVNTLIKGIALSETLLPTNQLVPGPGFGGSCLPKDITALRSIFEQHGLKKSIIHQVIASNIQHKKRIISEILSCNPHTVTLLGLAFKANTNDIRNASAIDIIEALMKHDITIKAYDPYAIENMKNLFPTIKYYDSPYEAAQNSDCIVILTEWQEIKNIDLNTLAMYCIKKNTPCHLIDTRRLFNKNDVISHGFNYNT